jgi:hypothetical protein
LFVVSAALAATGVVWSGGAAGASTKTTRAMPVPGGPLIRAGGTRSAATFGSLPPTISLNWSGYAALAGKNKKFNDVQTTFIQPRLTCDGKPNEWTSNWAGLDGFNNGTVEQDGTFAFCGGRNHMKPVYIAWYELFPAASVTVFPVRAGDTISASVRYHDGKFHLRIADVTRHLAASHAAKCSSCQRSSAEWIIERPALCNNSLTKCFITRLADFHVSTMADDEAQLAGKPMKGIGGFANIPIFMVNPLKSGGFITLDTVGAIVHRAFAAVWDRSGTTVPIKL